MVPRTAYLEAIDLFFRRTWLKPGEVAEGDFVDYIKFLHESKAARGTFRIARHGIAFFFKNTLGRDWPIFKKAACSKTEKTSSSPSSPRLPEAYPGNSAHMQLGDRGKEDATGNPADISRKLTPLEGRFRRAQLQ
ncbi:MAG: phage integrase N-terminal SAM-like domain-containing protein [Planctomycetota bacterium]|nr:phage integrase N-terminal SAM-like domain-containing protein [Planctomycetota bacterium]